MSIELSYDKEHGIEITNTLNNRNNTVSLSCDEQYAINLICKILNTNTIKLERRTDNYLSVISSDNDFCRIKLGARAKWFSLDFWGKDMKQFYDDARLHNVKNKNQRHWKITLNVIDDLLNYEDLIKTAYTSCFNQ